MPTSASSFSSSRRFRDSPRSPFSASKGYWFVAEAKYALPRPPPPPCASSTVCPGVVRSASSIGGSESATQTCVPTGMRMTTSSPSAPCFSAEAPLRPLPARNRRSYLNESNVLMFSSHSAMTFPPLPPSPPSGPPRGTNFSRLPLTAPSPPLPLLMWINTWSIIFQVSNSSNNNRVDAVDRHLRWRVSSSGDAVTAVVLRPTVIPAST